MQNEHIAAERLKGVRHQIAHAAQVAGRDAADIALVAVSKTWGADVIRPALTQGQRVFGESRVQEAEAKWPSLKAEYPDVSLHLIGHLQSNKAASAVALFDVIHSVDRSSLVRAISSEMQKSGRRPKCFIQVNIGAEAQKGGCAVGDLPALLAEAKAADLDVIGLMAIPPAGIEAAPFFALLAKLARDHGLQGLSMGMSADFETAIWLGSTHVRIGSALFGERQAEIAS